MLIDSGKVYIIALIFANILAWASFLSIIFFTNPQNTGKLGVAVLYFSGTLGLAGLPIILWQIIKLKKK